MEYKKANYPDSSKAETQKVQEAVRIRQIKDREHSDAFFQILKRCNEIAEQSTTLDAQSAQQLKSRDEQMTFTATKEDLEQNTTDIPAVIQRRMLVIQKAPRKVDILLQCIDTTRTARGLLDEVQRNPDGQEAALSIAQDREQEAECLRQ